MYDKEIKNLNDIAHDSHYKNVVNQFMIEHSIKIFSRFINGGHVLEMGPAEGIMTKHLVKISEKLTIVEASERFCKILRSVYPDLEINQSLFEEFTPNSLFDYIVLGHVLEHVIDPVMIVKRIKQWLKPNGKIIASVPNSRSLHRQAAVVMGILPNEESMSLNDIHDGHRRIYNPESFRYLFNISDMQIDYFGGFWLKPLSNNQIESAWSEVMIKAFMQLGERYPDIAAELCIVASDKRQSNIKV